MRNILVDRARRKASVKHGGGRSRVALDDADLPIELPNEDMLALDEALTRLEAADPRKAKIVMLHYFGGLTLEETAGALDTSPRTVEREWRFARAFLFTQLEGQQA
jgi:RNA polymerase sigma factor (TIGR02999 family)